MFCSLCTKGSLCKKMEVDSQHRAECLTSLSHLYNGWFSKTGLGFHLLSLFSSTLIAPVNTHSVKSAKLSLTSVFRMSKDESCVKVQKSSVKHKIYIEVWALSDHEHFCSVTQQLRTWMFGSARNRSVLSSGVSWGDQPPEKVVPVDTAHPSRPDINEPGGLRSVCTMNIVTYVNLCVTQHTSHCLSYLTPSTHTSINSFHVVWQSGPIWPVVRFWRAATGATTQSPDVRCLLRRLGLIWEHV